DVAGLNPSFSWSKLRWAREHLPVDAVERVRRITTLGSYVTARLAGDAVPAIDHSHASRTGFFDIRTARWMPRLVETSGWAADLLPPLVGSGTVLGALADELRAVWRVRALPVAVSGHDHFCAAFAAGVRGTGQLFLSSGTSEAHVLLIDSAPDRDLPP